MLQFKSQRFWERRVLTFEPKDLVPIIDAGYPDIRKIINTCQLNSNKGKLQVDTQNLLENDYKIKVLDILKSKDDKRNKYTNMRQAIIDSRVTDFYRTIIHYVV